MKHLLALIPALLAWALLGGGAGCGWVWSSDPLIFVQENEPCDADIQLWSLDEVSNQPVFVVGGLQHADCVAGFNRDAWSTFFLFCPTTGKSSPLLSRVELGAKNVARRAQCARRVEVGA